MKIYQRRIFFEDLVREGGHDVLRAKGHHASVGGELASLGADHNHLGGGNVGEHHESLLGDTNVLALFEHALDGSNRDETRGLVHSVGSLETTALVRGLQEILDDSSVNGLLLLKLDDGASLGGHLGEEILNVLSDHLATLGRHTVGARLGTVAKNVMDSSDGDAALGLLGGGGFSTAGRHVEKRRLEREKDENAKYSFFLFFRFPTENEQISTSLAFRNSFSVMKNFLSQSWNKK